MVLTVGALLGFFSVAFGAYADHGLKQHITVESYRAVLRAIRYNQVHALVIVAIGFAIAHRPKAQQINWLRWSGYTFILGTSLFCFSIYGSAVTGLSGLTNISPCLLYTSPSPRDGLLSRMPSSA